MNYIEKFKAETGLINKLGEGNAYLCWVMALYLDRNDVMGLATDDLTDGKNDKKMDAGKIKFILLDGMGNAVIRDDVTDSEMLGALGQVLRGV